MNQDTYAISSQFQTDKAGNTHAYTYFYRRPIIKGRALITFVCLFFRRDNIQGAMNNTSYKQTEILSEIELFSFQDFL